MKILQINKFFYRHGGADIHFLDLGRLLESRGHEVIHFSALDSRNEPSPYQSRFVKKMEMRGRRSPRDSFRTAEHILYSSEAARKLELLIQETKPEIAHLHNIYHHLSPSILPVLKKHQIPVVMTLHDYKLICPNYRLYVAGRVCERCKKRRYYQAIFHRCIFNQFWPSALAALEMSFHKIWGVYEKNVDVFISPSRFLKDKMREWGIGAEIEAMPNFIIPVTRPSSAEALLRRMDNTEPATHDTNVILSEAKDLKYSIVDPSTASGGLRMTSRVGKSYLLYFGRLSEEKGLLTLIEAMKELPQVHLRIVGDGPLYLPLKKGEIKRGSNVALVGRQSGLDLQQEIAGARAVVVPSEWYENCPLSVLEAMSHGKPVVASRIGGLPEIVREGESGLLFKPGDSQDLAKKIKVVWSEEGLAETLGQRAREQVAAENSPERYYERLMEIYQRLVSR